MKHELIYSQSKGVVWYSNEKEHEEARRIGKGYSGHPPYVNKGAAEALKAAGPIPRGRYRVSHPWDHVRLGPCSMFLEPLKDTVMHGRSGFFIHGDNSYGNQSASHGCIILPPAARREIAAIPRPLVLVVVD
jgi:lipoprotein-anchoring transpeptidase ErfK/SrfK